MKYTVYLLLIMALLLPLPGTSFADETGLRVSARNGHIRISSKQSTISEILEKLSRELGVKIQISGIQEDAVVACEIDGAGIAETLQKLVPGWNSLVFFREGNSIEIEARGLEDSDANREKIELPSDQERGVSDSSLKEENSGTSREEVLPPPDTENSDIMPQERSEDEDH